MATKPNERPNTAQAKKMFYDWLDQERPWAHYDSMYDAMEQIVSAAANCFAGERLYTQAEMDKLSAETMRLTDGLAVHPEDFDGPCLCNECKSYG